MTLLGHKDGDDFNEGVSYLEFVEFLMKHGVNSGWKLTKFPVKIDQPKLIIFYNIFQPKALPVN